VRGLHGCCNTEVREAFHILGAQELGVFYAVMGMALGDCNAGLFERIQNLLVRPVADGMGPYP
jgi:hypothetical protein